MADPRQHSFWQDEQNNLWAALSSILTDSYFNGAQGGVQSLPGNIQPLVDFDQVNQSALDFAKTYRYNTIKGITETTQAQTQQALSDWIQSGAPLSALDDALTPIFGADRADAIASTETTRAYAQGNMDAWESTGVVTGGEWMTSKDERVCPICGARNGQTVGIGDIDSAPPAHTRCRCWLKPKVSVDLVGKKIQAALA